MARQPMVTRTFMTTKAQILAVNIHDEKTYVVEMTLPRQYKDDKEILKTAEKMNEDESIRLVHVLSTEVVETLYGMPESQFVALAKPLPPRSGVKEDAEDLGTVPMED